MNKHVLTVIFTCSYILGIIAFSYHLLIYFTILLIPLYIYLLFFKKTSQKIFIFLIAFIIGVFNTSLNIKYSDELSSFSDTDIEAAAKVLTIPTNNIKDRTKFYAYITKASIDEKNIINKGKRAKTLVTINDETKKIKNIKIGDTLILKGRLKIPQYAQNPSQFDYAKYLQYKKTFSLLYVNNDWQIVSGANDYISKILSKLNDTRERILQIHAKNIQSPMLEILGGMIFGDDAVNPDEETKTSFVNSGIFHILAASGMNVTIIFGIWYFLANRLRLNYKISIITGVLLILFYTFMTGFGPPIIRATLMLIFILIGKLIDRTTSTITLLFIVAFLMLIFNPLMLFDVGFQLSFIVTFSLILTTPLLNFKINKWANNAIGACLIPVIAQFYAAPLQMFYFNTFTVYSVFANIAIIPALNVVSFLGFISSIIALIPSVAENICYIADVILNPFLIFIVKTAEFFSSLPNSVIFIKKPLFWQIVFYYTFVIGLTCIIKYKFFNKKTIIALCSVFFILLLSFIKIPNKNLEIIYFSTGNADSFLIKSPCNDYFMVDTSKNGYKGSSAPAKNIMIKYMRDNGIKDLYALILSHFDSDHAGGTVDILENINVKTLYITDVYENTTITDEIQNYVNSNKINQKIINDTQKIYDKNGLTVTLLKPNGFNIKDENQKSLIVHFSYFDKNFLFMGDGDVNSYNAIEDKYKQNITVMKSGHHGAKNTVSDEMAKNSEVFILSTGHNAYNHPHPDTIKTITKGGRKYLRTDHNNAIRVIAAPYDIKIQQYSPYNKKFVPMVK